MNYFMGIDLGTSSVKAVIYDHLGNAVSSGGKSYKIISPKMGYAEQDPHIWWQAAVDSITQAIHSLGMPSDQIVSVGFSGQMHGLVMMDSEGAAIGNAIIHCDTRSEGLLHTIQEKVGKELLAEITKNPLFSGFQLPSLLWVKQNLPDVYRKIKHILSPKDYIRYMLTGELGSEITDASATLLYDIGTNTWSDSIINKLDLDSSMLLPVRNSSEIAGYITSEAAQQTGLSKGTMVVYGAADQPAQATGNGIITPGIATSTIGTSGQILTCIDSPLFNQWMNTHTFCHTPEHSWYIMGAMLSAGLSMNWFSNKVLGAMPYHEWNSLAESAGVTVDNPIFHPYLFGERTPHMNSKAKATFFGLTYEHSKAHMIRAVMEGVVFALRNSLELIEGLIGDRVKLIASGGGAKSQLWLQIQADIFGREITTTAASEQACLGAAILAAVGFGHFKSIAEACAEMVKSGEHAAWPNKQNTAIYDVQYEKYQKLYMAVHQLYE